MYKNLLALLFLSTTINVDVTTDRFLVIDDIDITELDGNNIIDSNGTIIDINDPYNINIDVYDSSDTIVEIY